MEGDAEVLNKALHGRYRLVRELGHGASAHVYLCDDLQHPRRVALKLLRPELVGTVVPDRFRREIELAASLSHPHILTLLDSGEVDGRFYFVMPFVEGESLSQRLRDRGALPVDVALNVARDVGGALQHAHARGVVHRDVKPSNILLADDVALLADFGIARAMTSGDGSALTESGVAIGTPMYMSPEQFDGGQVDARSDVYSLGCVVYEMLAGEPPIFGSDPRVIAARVLTQQPAPIASLRPVPNVVGRAVDRALSKTPADRFDTVEEFVAALSHGSTQVLNRAPTRFHTRRHWRVATAAVALSVLGAGLWYSATRPATLDAQRVGVFPIVDRAAENGGGTQAEQVATYLGYLLDGTEPLRWEEGRDWMTPGERADPVSLPTDRKLELSRQRGVGRVLDGEILRDAGSVSVVVRLYDVGSGTLVSRQGATGPEGSSAAALAAQAVTSLLADLVGDRTHDLESLSAGIPSSVARFHQGEVAFRENRLTDALSHYEAAVRDDSTFALAALHGGLAAHWIHQGRQAEELLRLAYQTQEMLPPRFAHMARGMWAYLEGSANTAVDELRAALALAPEWAEGSMVLGEVYFHLTPDVGPLDSLAKSAYLDARRADPAFTVPLIPLAQYALWEQDVEGARAYLDSLRPDNLGTGPARSVMLLADCMEQGPDGIDWEAEVAEDPDLVVTTAHAATVRGSALRCAEAGARAVLGSANTSANRWGAFLLLQSVLSVGQRYEELTGLFDSESVAHLPTTVVYMYSAAAGHPVGEAAARAAEGLWERGLDQLRASELWVLGEFEAWRGGTERLAQITAHLPVAEDRISEPDQRRMREVLEAQLSVLRNEPDATAQLARLRPFGYVLWDMWGGLALERAKLAELYLEEGRWLEADRVAADMEGHRSVFNLLLLPRTLAVRVAVAEQLGRERAAIALRARITQLTSGLPSNGPSTGESAPGA